MQNTADGEYKSSDEFDESPEDDLELSDVSDEGFAEKSWIEWFCTAKGHEFFVEVDEDFIRDEINLAGLSGMQHFEKALDIILDNEDGDESEDVHAPAERAAPHLYGLIHARFLLSSRGLQLATSGFSAGCYGRCPNIMCKQQPALPIGLTDTPKVATCKLYCPKCKEIYHPSMTNKLGSLDGAYFGTSFAPLFCMVFPGLIANPSGAPYPKTQRQIYVPNVFGFKVHRNVKDMLRNEEIKTGTVS